MKSISEKEIIEKFIKLLENNLLFKGSPKGGGHSSPYKAPTTRQIYGKSNYDLDDYMEEEEEEEDDKKPKVKVYE